MIEGSREFVWTLTLLAISLTPGWSQAGSTPPGVDGQEGSVTQPVLDPDTPQTNQSSPTSDVDQPSIEPATSVSQSYLAVGLHFSGGGESDPSGTGNSPQIAPVSSILGSLNLQKLRPRSGTNIDYVGGATYNGSYGGSGAYLEQLHRLDVDHHLQWRRTQLNMRNSFYYMRDGIFGSSSFGGNGAYNLRFAENRTVPADSEAADYVGATQMPLGQERLITNVSAASLNQALTRRSSISFAGSYSIADYTGNSQNLSNGRQITAQVGYNYQVNRRDGFGVVYRYQRFQFTQAGVGIITTSSAQFVYRRRVLNRLALVLGAGPEVATVTGSTAANGQQLNATAQASLQYNPRTYRLGLSYDRLETGGFGVFAGGNSNIFRFSIAHTISRLWRVSLESGYATSTSVEASSARVPVGSYDYGFAGGAVQRQLGPRFSVFASYQFNHENWPCGHAPACTSGFQQHIALIGLDWNIRPIRLE